MNKIKDLIFHKWMVGLLAICSAIGAANEWLLPLISSGFPTDFIPTWIKTIIPIASFISFVGNKLTKKPDDIIPKN